MKMIVPMMKNLADDDNESQSVSKNLYPPPLLTDGTLAAGDVVHLESGKGGRRLTEAQLLSAARRAYRMLLKPKVPLEPQKVGFTHGRRVKHV